MDWKERRKKLTERRKNELLIGGLIAALVRERLDCDSRHAADELQACHEYHNELFEESCRLDEA